MDFIRKTDIYFCTVKESFLLYTIAVYILTQKSGETKQILIIVIFVKRVPDAKDPVCRTVVTASGSNFRLQLSPTTVTVKNTKHLVKSQSLPSLGYYFDLKNATW